MAIAFDNATKSGGFSASPSFSHTCTGSNLILIVAVNNNSSTYTNTTGVTYNGVALTRIVGRSNAYGGYAQDLWYLLNPATGTHTVAVTLSSGSASVWAASYTGCLGGVVDVNTGVHAASGSGGITIGITPTVDNTWMIAQMGDDGSNPTASTGWHTLSDNTSMGSCLFGDSNGAITISVLNNMSTSNTGQSDAIAITISPTAAPSGPTNLKSLDGNVKANIKSYNGNLLANIKSIDGNS